MSFQRFTARAFVVAALVLSAWGTHAVAQEDYVTVDLPGSWIKLEPGESKRVEIPGGLRQILKLYIQAEAHGDDGVFSVIVNQNNVKNVVPVPRKDPAIVLT